MVSGALSETAGTVRAPALPFLHRNEIMKAANTLFPVLAIVAAVLAIAGLAHEPDGQAPAVPAWLELVSSERIMEHIIALSGEDTREVASRGAVQAANYIVASLRASGWSVEKHSFNIDTRSGTVTVTNVTADYPGAADSDSVIILCTHYDSRAEEPGGHAPGADDNASGTAVLLELARVLPGIDGGAAGPRVKLLFFGGEEDSMLGSTRFVSGIGHERNRIIGAVNVDMIGYDSEGPKDFVIFTDHASRGLAQTVADCAGRISRLRCETTLTSYANSDHGAFWNGGVRAISIWEGYDHNPYYHSSHDTWDKLSPTFMKQLVHILLCAVLRQQPHGRPASQS